MLDGSFVQFYFWVFLSGVLVCHVSATSPTPRGRLQKSLLSGVAGFAVCAIFLSSDAITGRVGLSSLNGWHRQIGRASCRERECKYVSISVGAVAVKKTDLVKHTTHRYLN